MGQGLRARPAAERRQSAARARLAAAASGSGSRDRAAPLSRDRRIIWSVSPSACGATIVAIEPIVEAWNANHGVIDEDEQFFFAVVGRNRGRDIELDRGVVRIRFVE